jgi:uncharacterized repeat protein (TIGR02543 family)
MKTMGNPRSGFLAITALVLLVALVLVSCTRESTSINPTYAVTYNGNNSTGGSIPIDTTNYKAGQTVTVLGNTGNLLKTGYSFAGWNTLTDGTGTTYTQAQTFEIGAANVTLYAKWTANPTYTVTYNGNNSTGGSVPIDSTNYEQGQTITVLANTGNLVRINYSFSGWNTQADGSGTTYTQAQTFTMGSANVTLYAKWTANPTYTVTYNGNGNTGGSVPVDSTNYQQGQTVTVLANTGNLVRINYSFSGWNTQADGSGTTYTQAQTFTMGSANVTLYAKWTANSVMPVEPVVLEERNAGDFLVIDQSYTGSDTRWAVLFGNVLNQFYENHAAQNYDFIVLCPTKPMVSNWSTALNRHIDGIGGGYGTYPSAPNLNALIAFDLFPIWSIGFPAPEPNLLNGVLVHEIGHYWLVNIQWAQHDAIGHWQNNLDLFSGDTRYVDPMAYYHWILNNGQETCVNVNDPNATKKFSDLSLYIMGLLPPDQVPPIYEHEFELKPGNDFYNMWGPGCGDAHQFTGTRTITIQDIISTNGERNPTYIQSKKDFRIAFIVVTAKGEAVSQGFIDYVRAYSDALPAAWSQVTSGKSTMIIN